MHGIFVRSHAVRLDMTSSRVHTPRSPGIPDRTSSPAQTRGWSQASPHSSGSRTPGKERAGQQESKTPEAQGGSDEAICLLMDEQREVLFHESPTLTMQSHPTKKSTQPEFIELRNEKAEATMQRELTEAIENEDVECLNSLLPAANRLGIWSQDLERAQRMVNFKMQKQLLSELEAVRSIVTGLTDSIRTGVDHGATGKARATIDIGEVSEVGASSQMPESWLKMIQDSICKGIEQHVKQVVQTAVSEATKELLLETSELRQHKDVLRQNLDISKKADPRKSSANAVSPEMVKQVKKRSMKPSSICGSIPQSESSLPEQNGAPQQLERDCKNEDLCVDGTVEPPPSQTEKATPSEAEKEKIGLGQEAQEKLQRSPSLREDMQRSLSSIYSGAASLGAKVMQRQSSVSSMEEN